MVPLAGLPMWSEKHGLILDGGLSDLQILRGWADGSFNAVHDCARDAITACPFYCSRADIRPDEYVPLWWAFYPPPPDKVRDIYRMGQRNATNWIIATRGGTLPRTLAPAGGGRRPTWKMETAWHTAEEYVAASRAAVKAAGEAAGEVRFAARARMRTAPFSAGSFGAASSQAAKAPLGSLLFRSCGFYCHIRRPLTF